MPGSRHHAQAPEPEPDTSCLSLEVVAPPSTETNEVLGEESREGPGHDPASLRRGPPESLLGSGLWLKLFQYRFVQ